MPVLAREQIMSAMVSGHPLRFISDEGSVFDRSERLLPSKSGAKRGVAHVFCGRSRSREDYSPGSSLYAQRGVSARIPVIARAASLGEEAAPFGCANVSSLVPGSRRAAGRWLAQNAGQIPALYRNMGFHSSHTGLSVSGEAVTTLSSDRLVPLPASHAASAPRCAAPPARPVVFSRIFRCREPGLPPARKGALQDGLSRRVKRA